MAHCTKSLGCKLHSLGLILGFHKSQIVLVYNLSNPGLRWVTETGELPESSQASQLGIHRAILSLKEVEAKN